MLKAHQTKNLRLAGFRRCLLIVPVLTTLALTVAGPVNAQNTSEQSERSGLIEELGLWWGMSLGDMLERDEFTLEYMGKGSGGDHYAATAFPPVIDDLNQIILYFGFDDRLWRLAFLGVPEKDGSGVGTALFARYDEWKSVLNEMYGAGESFHRNTSPDVERPDLILATLRRGDAWHFTQYDRDDVHVQLGVKGTSMTFGHTAIYIKNQQMAAKVEADREAVEQSTSQTQPAPPNQTE